MLKIEVGKWYETRDGQAVQIVENDGDEKWPWIGFIATDKLAWGNGGEFLYQNVPDPLDLIKEIPSPKTPDHA